MTGHHHRDDQRAGRRQDLRNREPKFQGVDSSAPWTHKRCRWVRRALLLILMALLLSALYQTSQWKVFTECRALEDIPRYCVD